MSSKHSLTPADIEKGYEANDIGLKGIVYFAVGLLLLILITFILIWAFLGKLHEFATENAEPANPMAMSQKERLPPEPRLQAAPGFGVDSPNGRVNLELMAPQSEYRELRKEWDELEKNGRVDPKTGMVTMLPLDVAKEKLLQSNVKARSGADAVKLLKDSHMFVSDSSAGRIAGETRR